MKQQYKPAKRRTLSVKQWEKIRNKWESDPTLSLSQTARLFNVSLTSIKSHAKAEGWMRNENKIVKIDGRPSTYKPEYCQRIIDYFKDFEPYRELEDINNPSIIRLVPNKPKTMSGFAAEIGVTRQTLWQWAIERDKDGKLIRPEFFNSYGKAMATAENIIIQGAMCGAYNSSFSQLLLRNHHFYQQTLPVPNDHNQDKASDEELDQIYENALAQAAERQKSLVGRFERITRPTNKIIDGEILNVNED